MKCSGSISLSAASPTRELGQPITWVVSLEWTGGHRVMAADEFADATDDMHIRPLHPADQGVSFLKAE